ncbi:hypothetical protein GCM10010372_29870 [Streptomyces tauricus]|nr:hypothetical protein GCM10010372_29870 [Streptomyces tauricus]
MQYPSYEGDAQGVFGADRGPVAGPGAETEGQGEPDIDHGEDTEPQEEGAGVGAGDGPVDHYADQDRNQGFPDLVSGGEQRAETDVPALLPDRLPQDVTP